MTSRRIGIVGYGNLGQYLVSAILQSDDLELAFVWNRSPSLLESQVDKIYICEDLEDVSKFQPDLIVEVCHPTITRKYGAFFLSKCDFLVGSPTALAEKDIEITLRQAATTHGLYVPSGAFWGGEDIIKMATRGTLKGLRVTMKKHPTSFKLEEPLKTVNQQVTDVALTLYDGPVKDLCPLAPNNVNTMAAAAIAGHNLGFDKVVGRLVSDPKLKDWHIVEVDVTGPDVHGNTFTVSTVRKNPANPGAVTGTATYASFLSSIMIARNKGAGVHMC